MSMALEAVSSNDPSNIIIYDTISASPHYYNGSSEASFLLESDNANLRFDSLRSLNVGGTSDQSSPAKLKNYGKSERFEKSNLSTQGRKKRRRRPRVSKSKEEAETQRMTHIAVERNRRKQMNDHLAVLRSLMPESYIQRGDQASIVGGAIEFVKELEQLLQSLEAQKHLLLQQKQIKRGEPHDSTTNCFSPPFAQFFGSPQYSWCQIPSDYTSKNRPAVIADIEVTLIETHANVRILSQKRPRQLLQMVAGLQTLRLTVLHLNVTTLDSFVLYSFSVKVEEGCHFTSVDDIAGAVHHMLGIIEEEAATC